MIYHIDNETEELKMTILDALYYGLGCGIALAIYALALWIYNKGFEAGIKARK